jgi:SAM-dependent methyltransferase
MTTTVPDQSTAIDLTTQVDELAGRLLEAGVGALELFTIAIGDALGLYRAVGESPSSTAAELAERLSLDLRYVTEWCDQQAIAGLLLASSDPRRFTLAPGVTEVLVDPLSPAYLAPVARFPGCVGDVLPALIDGFRTGAGVPYADYGPAAVAAQAAINRPSFVHALAQEWVPAIPGLEARLQDTSRPAVVADIGCGAGWATIALAAAYPAISAYGFDADAASIEQARANAAEAGAGDRLRFELVDGAPPVDGIDVAFFFECLHDMAHPTDVLRQLRASLADDGCVIVMDERAADDFTAPGDLIERYLASSSVTWCLPQSRTDADSEALGTLLRPATMTRIAADAGYASCEIVAIEHPVWRFYRLER